MGNSMYDVSAGPLKFYITIGTAEQRYRHRIRIGIGRALTLQLELLPSVRPFGLKS